MVGSETCLPGKLTELSARIRHIECHRCVSFQSLPSGHMQGTFEQANKEENRDKNRYPNILPSKILLFLRGRWRSD